MPSLLWRVKCLCLDFHRVEAVILSSPHNTLESYPPLIPATFLPIPELHGHDCEVVFSSGTLPRPDLMQTPLQKPDLILDREGSCSQPPDAQYLSGYAVVTDFDILEPGALPHGTSSQAAEL